MPARGGCPAWGRRGDGGWHWWALGMGHQVAWGAGRCGMRGRRDALGLKGAESEARRAVGAVVGARGHEHAKAAGVENVLT